MKIRALTGLVFIVVMLFSLFLGEIVFGVFYLLLASACLAEFYTMFGVRLSKGDRMFGLFLGFLSFAVLIAYRLKWLPDLSLSPVLFLLLPVLLILQLWSKTDDPFGRSGRTLLGLVYVIGAFMCFHGLAYKPGRFDALLPLVVLLLLWANDTGAYVVGRAFGRTKLFERISPNKTWEGFLGGLLSAVVIGIVVYRNTGLFTQGHWLLISGFTATMGTLGDLVESQLKRSLNVKDSGTLLPGHGGLLDRFDSLLFAAPTVFILLSLI